MACFCPRFVPCYVEFDKGKHKKVPLTGWTNITPEQSRDLLATKKFGGHRFFIFLTGDETGLFVIDIDRKNHQRADHAEMCLSVLARLSPQEASAVCTCSYSALSTMAAAWLRLSDSESLPMGRWHTALQTPTSSAVSPVTSRPKTSATLLPWLPRTLNNPAAPKCCTSPAVETNTSCLSLPARRAQSP